MLEEQLSGRARALSLHARLLPPDAVRGDHRPAAHAAAPAGRARAGGACYAAALDEHAAELAEHFSHSTDPDDLAKAVRYGELAAQRAMAVYAYGEAARHLEQALEVQEVLDPDDTVEALRPAAGAGRGADAAGEPRRVPRRGGAEGAAMCGELLDQRRFRHVSPELPSTRS